jgi:hypothetical protein
MVSCAKIVEGGLTCGAEAQRDGIYCFLHDDRPETILKAQNARRKGGRAAHALPAPADLQVNVDTSEGILKTLKAAAQLVADGRLDRSRATGIGYLLSTATQALKVHTTEERLRRIEKRLRVNENPLEEDDAEEAESADEA